jgi:hypothetical protein
MKKQELIERVIRFLEAYPEEWHTNDHGAKHQSGIAVSCYRFAFFIPITNVTLNSYRIDINDRATRKRLKRALRHLKELEQQEHERQSVKEISNTLLSTLGRTPPDIAKKRANGDI